MICQNKAVFLALFCLFTLPPTASAYGSYYQSQLNDTSTSKNLTFNSTQQSQTVWINIPRKVNVTYANFFGAICNYSRQITIENINATDILYANWTVNISINTTDTSKFQTDCDDLRIFYKTMEISRNITSCGTANTQVWFQLQNNISVSSNDTNYYVRYCDPIATAGPNQLINIYLNVPAWLRNDYLSMALFFDYGNISRIDDLSVYGNNGSEVASGGKGFNQCLFGQCIYSNGDKDREYKFPYSASIDAYGATNSTNFTFSFYFWTNMSGNNTRFILDSRSATGTPGEIGTIVYINDTGYLLASMNGEGKAPALDCPTRANRQIKNNTWYHFILMANHTGCTTFLDGTYLGSGTDAGEGDLWATISYLHILDRYDSNYGPAFQGKLENFFMFNRSLSLLEIDMLNYYPYNPQTYLGAEIGNFSIDTGNDGKIDNYSLTPSAYNLNITRINQYLQSTCTADWATGTCDVPFNITSATTGILALSGINVSGYYFNQIGSCGGLYSQALNFSFKNETSLSSITASAEYTITMLDGSGQEYNASTGTVPSFNVCMLNGSFSADMIIKYEKTGTGTRSYFLDNATLISLALNNITLYLLDNSLGNSISITVQNVFGYPISGAYVQFQRYYIGENTYRVVAMLKTDDKGLADVFLNTDDMWYKYVITQNGEVLRVIGPSTIIGTTLVLSTSAGEILTWEDYATGISYSCTYSNSSYYLTCTVANPSGLANQVCLDVDEYNIVNISDYDLQCGTGASMTLISNLTSMASYNRTVRYMLYVVSPFVILESGSFQLGETMIIYGLFGVLLTAVIFMIAAGIGIWNPAAGIITGIAGIIIAVTLGLFSVPILALGSLIFVSIIIAYKVKT